MRLVDLTKLRPGDIIFTTALHYQSFGICALTFGRFSHALVVVYPDVWWETDGRGAGYRVIENPRAFMEPAGKPIFVAAFRYASFRVIRLANPPSLNALLGSIGPNICLEYPSTIEFLPLAIGFRRFPQWTAAVVRKRSARSGRPPGMYCSQLVLRTLQGILAPVAALPPTDHITPSRLFSLLERHGTDVTGAVLYRKHVPQHSDPVLAKKFSHLTRVARRLADFQYPHSKSEWSAAIERLFQRLGISYNPAGYAPHLATLQGVLSSTRHFRLHALFWPNYYT